MSSITKQHIGKYTYLYESTSYRDDQGRPRNKKVKIGKIDPYSGETIYTSEYIKKAGLTPPSKDVKNQKDSLVEDAKEILDSVKDYGVYWFLVKIAEKTGLYDILQSSFPSIWKEIFTLACYLIVSDKPVMYCEDWLSENEWIDVKNMSSQRISDLLCSFGETERNRFYKEWYEYVKEREYVALDITSISSYSQNRTECEWGHNRDGEKLPQTNLCMLFGETSRLPIYQTNYSGSLSDVSTLECTTSKFQAMFGESELSFVMDKGFFSKNNVNMLLEKKVDFLISVPFTSAFAKKQVESERKDIDCLDNVIVTNGEPLRGVHKLRAWKDGVKLHTHIYFDTVKALKERNELFALITKLKNVVETGIDYDKYRSQIERYLIVRKSTKNETGLTITVRDDAVTRSLETAGWLVLISNHISDPKQALNIYRTKDVVEKAFWKYKNNLGIDRLRVHSDERADNKTFVAFIALILSSHIHNIMKDKHLFERTTFDGLFLTLAKLKSAFISGRRVLRPLTKLQKDLFESFLLPFPVG